jgi:hypothetical protein
MGRCTARREMVEALQDYATMGTPVGDFLRAVLENDLMAAIGRADDNNFANLPAVAGFVFNELPRACWGSRDVVAEWFERRRVEREAYAKLLQSHDWSHEFSDDGRVYNVGRQQLEVLRAMQRSIDPWFRIWNQHCPDQCKDGRAYS